MTAADETAPPSDALPAGPPASSAERPVSPGERPAPSGERPPPGARRGTAVDWLLVLAVTALCGWIALTAIFYLPLHVGAVPLPVSALLGVGAMIVGPRTAYRLTGSMLAAFLPAVAWLVVSVWLTLNRNDVMLTAPVTVTSGQWRLMLLLGLGALAAAATLALLSGDRLRDKIARERAAGGVAGGVPGDAGE